MKLSFALPKAKASTTPAPLKPTPALTSLGDDTDTLYNKNEEMTFESASGSSSNAAANKRPLANRVAQVQTSSILSRITRKALDEQQKIDKTIFEYDEVYDVMKMAETKAKEMKEAESQTRKPKYINSLLSSAATRKLDYIRAEEKMMKREREMEGDEFADKESFVTKAYQDQMAEVRRAEAEEKMRIELEKAQKTSSFGMASFYKELLNKSEQQHNATVEATAKAQQRGLSGPQGTGPNMTITKPDELNKISDIELARIAREEGKAVELNDDNQIVDKRELLSAGLNLSAPNTRNLAGLRNLQRKSKANDEKVQIHTAVGAAASHREINERRAREVEKQILEEAERIKRQQELEAKEQEERIVRKRNNEETIQSARERYLERKRRKLDEERVDAEGTIHETT
ncbi:hypothetical protein Clacol_006363 [Clathrus columnatus]|uniref:Nuclear speckle splicing regulatory protein 1 N-terminal domain-containing protein n=1 Tax=Clathrus columnatus TaxID=1419009 RepID=A0AAV5ABV6_9AGAM|nr:hypothetical protein Clacol_006363 [Clathrus columnatus]